MTSDNNLVKIIEWECFECRETLRATCTPEEYKQYLENEKIFDAWPEELKEFWQGAGWALEPYTRCYDCWLDADIKANPED